MPFPVDVFEYPDSELVIAFVAATGTNTDPAQSTVENYLKKLGYAPRIIRVSRMLAAVKERFGLRSELSDATEYDRLRTHMNTGTEARRRTGFGRAIRLCNGSSEIMPK